MIISGDYNDYDDYNDNDEYNDSNEDNDYDDLMTLIITFSAMESST